jgi:hypothetical protein
MFMGHDSERSAVPILLEQADVGGLQMLLGYSKLDTTELLTRVATFPLATKAGEAGVITGAEACLLQRQLDQRSCRSGQGPTFSRNYRNVDRSGAAAIDFEPEEAPEALALDHRRYPDHRGRITGDGHVRQRHLRETSASPWPL